MNEYKIMIVEDDPTIAGAVAEHLTKWGFQTYAVSRFAQVMEDFQREGPHLVIMDISLPLYSGYHWCQEIRKLSKVPVLFLSSRTDNMDVVMAVSMGGDDYITKPFSLEVLVAKVQALLRRSYDFQGALFTLAHRGAVFNIGELSLRYNGEKIDLTKNEASLLQLLMENKGTVVSREAMMQRLWDSDAFVDDNTLTVNVARLRKKLEDAGLAGFITTKKGQGYVVEAT